MECVLLSQHLLLLSTNSGHVYMHGGMCIIRVNLFTCTFAAPWLNLTFAARPNVIFSLCLCVKRWGWALIRGKRIMALVVIFLMLLTNVTGYYALPCNESRMSGPRGLLLKSTDPEKWTDVASTQRPISKGLRQNSEAKTETATASEWHILFA